MEGSIERLRARSDKIRQLSLPFLASNAKGDRGERRGHPKSATPLISDRDTLSAAGPRGRVVAATRSSPPGRAGRCETDGRVAAAAPRDDRPCLARLGMWKGRSAPAGGRSGDRHRCRGRSGAASSPGALLTLP